MKKSLLEIAHVRQVAGEPRRRWFASDTLDLVVWLGDGSDRDENGDRITGFQLCYDKLHAERALTWRAEDRHFLHRAVDDGESAGLAHKASPVLVPDGVCNAEKLLGDFLLAADELPSAIRELVSRELRQLR